VVTRVEVVSKSGTIVTGRRSLCAKATCTSTEHATSKSIYLQVVSSRWRNAECRVRGVCMDAWCIYGVCMHV